MSKKEAPLHALSQYLPEGVLDDVLQYLHQYRIHLTISRERTTLLGDYRNATTGKNHRISVNGNLNPFAFLITLLHEIAHLITFEAYGHKAAPHGKEWKQEYSKLLAAFLLRKVFPPDIEKALLRSIANPSATTCGETNLMRVLKRYDAKKDGWLMVEELQVGALFRMRDGTVFRRGEKLRKRIRCTKLQSGQEYLFSAVYEVEVLDGPPVSS